MTVEPFEPFTNPMDNMTRAQEEKLESIIAASTGRLSQEYPEAKGGNVVVSSDTHVILIKPDGTTETVARW